MQKILLLVATLAMIILIGSCSKEVTTNDINIKDGIVYEISSGELFDGVLVCKNETTGYVFSEDSYKNGKKHGLCKTFGEVCIISDYKDGKKHGLCKAYHHDKLSDVSSYKGGKLHGEYICYDMSNGEVLYVEYYNNGTKIEESP